MFPAPLTDPGRSPRARERANAGRGLPLNQKTRPPIAQAMGAVKSFSVPFFKKEQNPRSPRVPFYSSQMAVAPQGTTPPVAETGRPISSQLVLPPKRGTSVVWSIYSMTAGDRPVV